MPFTPFHLGPGIALKRLAGQHLSLSTFAGAQVLIDLEPGIGMLRGASVLHGYSHTLAGALLIALACVPLRGLAEKALKLAISARQALLGGLAGTLTHLLLDGMVHSDIRPWWPLSDANPMQDLLSWEHTEALCLLLALPALTWLPQAWRRLRATPWH